jgi:putative membrane protein
MIATMLVASIGITACGRTADDTAMSDTAGGVPAAARMDSMAMGATDSVGAATGTAATGAPMSEAEVVTAISLTNGTEIASSRIAVEKATNADVKSFARQMIDDHQKMQGEVDRVATAENISPATPLDTMAPAMTQMRNTLQSADSGAAFDRAYMDMQVRDHQAALDKLNQAAAATQNAELRGVIQKAIPQVQKHLDRARELQTNLASATP